MAILSQVAANDVEMHVCDDDNDGYAYFNLNDLEDDIAGGNADLQPSYYLTLQNAQNGGSNTIPNPNMFQNTSAFYQMIYARVVAQSTQQFTVVEIDLFVHLTPQVTPYVGIVHCTEDGVSSTFNLTISESTVLGNQDPTQFIVSYFETLTDAENNVIPTTSITNTVDISIVRSAMIMPKLHENFLFGKIVDYSAEDDQYARARKGPQTSIKDKMLALPIRDSNYQLRNWLEAYQLPSMYFWIVAGLGILVGTLGLKEVVLIGYFFLSLCHSLVTALASWSIYEYRAPFEPIYIIIGVVGLSKVIYAIRTNDFGAFKRLFRVLHIAVFSASLGILPIILLHESQSPTILGRYSTFLFFLGSIFR